MKLHKDTDAFKVLISNVSERTGYREDVLEKDYYVTLILEELADYQRDGLKAFFKGGTALYKALKKTNRFSEDIDLSVDTRECSRTQNDKRLERATKKYKSLERDPSAGRTNRSEVIAVYIYDPVTSIDSEDALQRFGRVKIEATSFTISEPMEKMTVSAMLYDYALDQERDILEKQYGVKPFEIETISLERAFIDKLFAAEAYVRASDDNQRAFEAAKHIYDLAVLENQSFVQSFIKDNSLMRKILDIRLDEEMGRLDGIPNVKPKDFRFFHSIDSNLNIKRAYQIMQNQYVMLEKDRIPFDDAVNSVKRIETKLRGSYEWMK